MRLWRWKLLLLCVSCKSYFLRKCLRSWCIVYQFKLPKPVCGALYFLSILSRLAYCPHRGLWGKMDRHHGPITGESPHEVVPSLSMYGHTYNTSTPLAGNDSYSVSPLRSHIILHGREKGLFWCVHKQGRSGAPVLAAWPKTGFHVGNQSIIPTRMSSPWAWSIFVHIPSKFSCYPHPPRTLILWRIVTKVQWICLRWAQIIQCTRRQIIHIIHSRRERHFIIFVAGLEHPLSPPQSY